MVTPTLPLIHAFSTLDHHQSQDRGLPSISIYISNFHNGVSVPGTGIDETGASERTYWLDMDRDRGKDFVRTSKDRLVIALNLL